MEFVWQQSDLRKKICKQKSGSFAKVRLAAKILRLWLRMTVTGAEELPLRVFTNICYIQILKIFAMDKVMKK